MEEAGRILCPVGTCRRSKAGDQPPAPELPMRQCASPPTITNQQPSQRSFWDRPKGYSTAI